MYNHYTSNCVKLEDQILVWLNSKRVKVEDYEKTTMLDEELEPNMIDV